MPFIGVVGPVQAAQFPVALHRDDGDEALVPLAEAQGHPAVLAVPQSDLLVHDGPIALPGEIAIEELDPHPVAFAVGLKIDAVLALIDSIEIAVLVVPYNSGQEKRDKEVGRKDGKDIAKIYGGIQEERSEPVLEREDTNAAMRGIWSFLKCAIPVD